MKRYGLTNKKLGLKKETLRSLSADQLEAVAGGQNMDPSGQSGSTGATYCSPCQNPQTILVC